MMIFGPVKAGKRFPMPPAVLFLSHYHQNP